MNVSPHVSDVGVVEELNPFKGFEAALVNSPLNQVRCCGERVALLKVCDNDGGAVGCKVSNFHVWIALKDVVENICVRVEVWVTNTTGHKVVIGYSHGIRQDLHEDFHAMNLSADLLVINRVHQIEDQLGFSSVHSD